MKEIWRPVKDYSGLFISNFFRVKDVYDDNKTIRRYKEPRGLYVTVYKYNKLIGDFEAKKELVEYLFNSSFDVDTPCKIPNYNIQAYNLLK